MITGTFNQSQFLAWESTSRDTIDLKKIYVDIAGGDLVSGVLLSQIVYWHLPSKTGGPKLQVQREGHFWLAKTYAELWEEVRIKDDRARLAYSKLAKLGLIEKRVWKFGKRNAVHVRIVWPVFLAALAAEMGSGEPAKGGFTNLENADSRTRESPETLTENTKHRVSSEIKREEHGIPENSEFRRVLQELRIPDSLIQEVQSALNLQHADAAVALTLAMANGNQVAYCGKVLRAWAKYPDEAVDGLENARHVWKCQKCDTWNQRRLECRGCYGPRDEVIERWAVPRET